MNYNEGDIIAEGDGPNYITYIVAANGGKDYSIIFYDLEDLANGNADVSTVDENDEVLVFPNSLYSAMFREDV